MAVTFHLRIIIGFGCVCTCEEVRQTIHYSGDNLGIAYTHSCQLTDCAVYTLYCIDTSSTTQAIVMYIIICTHMYIQLQTTNSCEIVPTTVFVVTQSLSVH